MPITIAEAVRGADVEVPTLHGTKKLRVPGGTKHGTVQRLRGEGPPLLGKGSQRGDIHYRFVIDVPRDLSDEQREAVEALSKTMNGNPRERLMREAKATTGDAALMAARRTRVTAKVATSRGVFMISVAAELAEMHPQTLRMYEARGLIEPQRSPKGTRLYSQDDVERLRRIQEMTTEWGMNLAGVERVLELEEKLNRMRRKVEALEARAGDAAAGDRGPRGGQALREGRDRALRGAGDGADPGRAALAPPLTFAAGSTASRAGTAPARR